jgi:FkbM family methyltransferase
VIKDIIKNHFLGRTRYQPFWERLHSLSLSGMNFGCSAATLDEGERWVIDHVKKKLTGTEPVVVFDVGANIGTYSLEILEGFGDSVRLFCFEPSQESHDHLTVTLSKYKNVECFNFGFGEMEEAATLYSYVGQSGLSSMYDRRIFNQNGSDKNQKRTEEVNLKTLDSFCTQRGISHIGLLKMDVEGHEFMALKGGQKLINSGSIDFIQFEFGGTYIDSRIFFQDLCSLFGDNYEIYRILKDGLALVDYDSAKHEIFLYSNYLAVSCRL